MYNGRLDSVNSDTTHTNDNVTPLSWMPTFKMDASRGQVGKGTARWTSLWVGWGVGAEEQFLFGLYVQFTCNILLGLKSYTIGLNKAFKSKLHTLIQGFKERNLIILNI